MTPHAILGLHFDATRDEISAAYRRLVKDCHPDLHPGDPGAAERFRRLSDAYRQLMSESGRPGGRPAAARTAPPTSVTVRRNVFLTVHEAMTGCRKTIEGLSGPCPACSGAGRVPSPGPVECTSCIGTGISQKRQSGFIRLRVECADCAGTGKVTWFTCHECSGLGRVHMDSCEVDIPPATRSGDRLVIPGGASDIRENTVGDAEITVVVKDPRFRINGNDIETVLDLELWDAVLGTKATVVLPDGGSLRLDIPADTPSGGRFRVRGRGLNYTEERGDLVVIARVRQPNSADHGVREVMETLRDMASGGRAGSPRAHKGE